MKAQRRGMALLKDSKGRDFDILEPVCSYLEVFHQAEIDRLCVLDEMWKIQLLSKRYDFVILPNSSGSPQYFKASKFVSKAGIFCISLMSEGDFTSVDDERVKRSFWGWNRDEKCYFDLSLQWSDFAVGRILKNLPEVPPEKIQATGGTGFDKYYLQSPEEFKFALRPYQQARPFTVGIAGWTFDRLGLPKWHQKHPSRGLCAEDVRALAKSLKVLQQAYRDLVKALPDVSFVLKPHPREKEDRYDSQPSTEFDLIEFFPNTRRAAPNEDILSVISTVDIWITFLSTTALEAWLLDKPCLSFRPLDFKFAISEIPKNCLRVKSPGEAIEYIRELRLTGKIADFNRCKKERNLAIERVIGWQDGRNCQRTAKAIITQLDRTPKKKRFQRLILCWIEALFFAALHRYVYSTPLRFLIYFQFVKYARTQKKIRSRFKQEELQRNSERYRSSIQNFFQRVGHDG